jgi:hypothetical protein
MPLGQKENEGNKHECFVRPLILDAKNVENAGSGVLINPAPRWESDPSRSTVIWALEPSA